MRICSFPARRASSVTVDSSLVVDVLGLAAAGPQYVPPSGSPAARPDHATLRGARRERAPRRPLAAVGVVVTSSVLILPPVGVVAAPDRQRHRGWAQDHAKGSQRGPLRADRVVIAGMGGVARRPHRTHHLSSTISASTTSSSEDVSCSLGDAGPEPVPGLLHRLPAPSLRSFRSISSIGLHLVIVAGALQGTPWRQGLHDGCLDVVADGRGVVGE